MLEPHGTLIEAVAGLTEHMKDVAREGATDRGWAMHQDMSVGAAIRILTNCNLREDTAVPGLEPLPDGLQQPLQDLAVRILSNSGAGPIDVDSEVQRISTFIGELGGRTHILDLGLP